MYIKVIRLSCDDRFRHSLHKMNPPATKSAKA
jgi:hypothetical protein